MPFCVVYLCVCLCPCIYIFKFIMVCTCNFYFHEYKKKTKKNNMPLGRSAPYTKLSKTSKYIRTYITATVQNNEVSVISKKNNLYNQQGLKLCRYSVNLDSLCAESFSSVNILIWTASASSFLYKRHVAYN